MSVLRQNLDHLATLLHAAGITRWAVSPGSRNAPIVAGFIRHGGFELHSFPDERSAAFAALGMAMAYKYPAGVICTSGSAALNLYPAICEAYYQRIPLFSLTADRPEELIDQWDGQTIHQKNIFEKHILQSFEVPDMNDEYSTLLLESLVYEAAELTITPVQGPVHLNVPLRDPIYEGMDDSLYHPETHPPFQIHWPEHPTLDGAVLHADLNQYKKILLLFGQSLPNIHIQKSLEILKSQYPIFADITSNVVVNATPGWETALFNSDIPKELEPELIISFGLSFVSKPLKKYLQQSDVPEHWHISPAGFVGDPFLSDPEVKRIDPATFLSAMAAVEHTNCLDYKSAWDTFCEPNSTNKLKSIRLKNYHKLEFQVVEYLLQNCPKNSAIHLGNSMPIRYAGWAGNTDAEIYCNRGTSGIDGTLSTAVGYAKTRPDQHVICITGDVGFFYDSNAFWCDGIPKNLKVILLNNFGGKIFDFIEGPEKEPKLKPFIQSPHELTAKHIADHYGIAYEHSELAFSPKALQDFLENKGCGIFEIITVK